VSGSIQLPLALRYPVEQRFECFLPVDAAEPGMLRRAITAGERVYINGPAGSGKTHLLLASAAEFDASGGSVAYLPLAGLGAHLTAVVQSQPATGLICIDDLDHAAGDADAELALFALHNRQGDAGGALLYAASGPPETLRLTLPDLRSRLGHCLQLPLISLDETQRRELLVARARARGLALEDTALDYLFRRVGRDLGNLTALLDRLDRASLAAQRRLTVPFLRQVLESGG
jgi:DnaA family protein